MNDIFVSLDLETTGLDPVNDEIIEIGAVKFDINGVIDTYHSMAKPSRPVPYRIQILTGITDRDLQNAPKLPVALNELVAFLGNSTIIGQNIGFDLAFLAEKDVTPRPPRMYSWRCSISCVPSTPPFSPSWTVSAWVRTGQWVASFARWRRRSWVMYFQLQASRR